MRTAVTSNYLNGNLSHVIAYQRALTANERTLLHNYLTGRIPT